MKIQLVKVWVFGRARYRVEVLSPGRSTHVLADDVSYDHALDLAVRWKAKNRCPSAPVTCDRREPLTWRKASLRHLQQTSTLPPLEEQSAGGSKGVDLPGQ